MIEYKKLIIELVKILKIKYQKKSDTFLILNQ
jgi:uncharacterized protein YaaW (UPF0174 family)